MYKQNNMYDYDNNNYNNWNQADYNSNRLSPNEKIKSLKQKINELNNTISNYEKRINFLEKEYETLENYNSELNNSNDINNKKIERLNKLIKEKDNKIKELNGLDNKIKIKENEINRLNKQNEDIKNENHKLIKEKENTINQLNNINQENKSEIDKLKNQLEKEKNNSNDLVLKINCLDKNNKELNNQIPSYKQQINKLEHDNENNKKIIKNLNLQKDSKNKEIAELKDKLMKKEELISKKIKEIDDIKNLLISKEKEITLLTGEPTKLRLDYENLKKSLLEMSKNTNNKDIRIKSLEEDYMKSKKEIEKLSQYLQNLQKEKNIIDNQLKESKIKIDNLTKDQINNKKLKEENEENKNKLNRIAENSDKSSEYENIKKEDFYDIIIKCNSIYGLKEGWDVLMNEKGKKNYLENKSNKYTKIGVIGSENRGKSTILQDFSKIELPTGVSIKTEGLSIKYPDLEKFKNRKIILLDSAGLETPILNNNKNDENENKNNKEENKNEIGNRELCKFKKLEKENDIFQDKSRDIIQLELFLQNFIIKYSDILLLILGKLTINEQKLLIKVKKYIEDLNRKEPLIIIHNLKEFETLKQVDDYINNTLKLSSTFSLEINHEVNLDNEESNWIHFFEPESDPKIYHLIYGKKGSEAGDFYNNKTLEFIYSLISSIPDKESFDPIECIKNYLIEISQNILEHPIKKGGIIDNRELNQIIENNNANEIKKIMLDKSYEKIILKKCLLDELGISISQLNGFSVQYSYYLTDNNLYVYIELPGKKENPEEDTDYENVEIDTDIEGSLSIIKVSGIKKHNIEHHIKDKIIQSYHKRQFGEFNLEVKLDKINLNDDYEVQIKDGWLLIIFGLKKKSQKKKI